MGRKILDVIEGMNFFMTCEGNIATLDLSSGEVTELYSECYYYDDDTMKHIVDLEGDGGSFGLIITVKGTLITNILRYTYT